VQKNESPDELSPHQADRLQTLNEISRVVSGTLDLQKLYETIFEQIGRVMDTTLCFIALVSADGKRIELPYYREAGDRYHHLEFPHEGSVTSSVIKEGKALLFHTEEEYSQYAREHGVPEIIIGDEENIPSRSLIYVPLHTESRTIGALSVQSSRNSAYAEDDVHTLSVIASQAAVAIVNARLYEQSQAAVRQMEALLHIAQLISGSLDLPTVLDAILTGMREVLPYYFAAILLPDHAKQQLDIAGTVGAIDDVPRTGTKIPFGRGITGLCFARGEPIIGNDARERPDAPQAAVSSDDIGSGSTSTRAATHQPPEIRSEMAVPLKRGDTVVGVLDVGRVEADGFSRDDLALISLFASQAAIAIENARLFTEQQNRVFELITIQSIVQKLTPLHDIPAIAALISDEIKALIDFHTCRLFRLDPTDDMLVPIAFEGATDPDLRLKVGEGITGWIALHGKSAVVQDTLHDDRSAQIAGTPRRAESLIGAPLIYEGRVRGVISLTKLGTNQFDENALRLLEIIAAQAAIAFDRARLYDELRTEAVTDELTKLYNRRYLSERFKEEKSRAIRNHHNLVALMLDIDSFKVVNDSYGHDAGDVVLRELAGVARAVVRAEDIVARYGGEEFCILLPEIPLDDAEQVAERLRVVVERHRLPDAAGVRHITVSLGMAILRPDDEGNELFSRADLAMYEVKHVGGNRLCISDGSGFRFLGPDPIRRLIPRKA
jgi:diguanylate cyclase (GGDEF)-like protein